MGLFSRVRMTTTTDDDYASPPTSTTTEQHTEVYIYVYIFTCVLLLSRSLRVIYRSFAHSISFVCPLARSLSPVRNAYVLQLRGCSKSVLQLPLAVAHIQSLTENARRNALARSLAVGLSAKTRRRKLAGKLAWRSLLCAMRRIPYFTCGLARIESRGSHCGSLRPFRSIKHRPPSVARNTSNSMPT